MAFDSMALQCLVAIAETGSFTKAAERVGRTQSAISQQISKLESLLGKPLIHRGNSISLTTDGEIFLNYARRILTLQREAIERFKEPELEGEVRLGLPEDFASVILSDVLIDFSRLHPHVILNVECDLSYTIYNNYQKGLLDLVLVKMVTATLTENGHHIWSEPVEWIGDPSLLATMGHNRVIPLVLSPHPCVYRENAINALEKAGMAWRLVYSSPSYAGKMAAVKAGLGITATQRTMIPPYLARIHTNELPPLNHIHVSLLKRPSSNKAIESLAYFLLHKLKAPVAAHKKPSR